MDEAVFSPLHFSFCSDSSCFADMACCTLQSKWLMVLLKRPQYSSACSVAQSCIMLMDWNSFILNGPGSTRMKSK